MTEPLTDMIMQKIYKAVEQNHRLVLVAATDGASKTVPSKLVQRQFVQVWEQMKKLGKMA